MNNLENNLSWTFVDQPQVPRRAGQQNLAGGASTILDKTQSLYIRHVDHNDPWHTSLHNKDITSEFTKYSDVPMKNLIN